MDCCYEIIGVLNRKSYHSSNPLRFPRCIESGVTNLSDQFVSTAMVSTDFTLSTFDTNDSV